MRIKRVLIAAALAASTAVGVAPPSGGAASTVDVSVTNGPPGTRIEVSAADCTADSEESFQYLTTRLVVGTAPNERLAGVGYSAGGDGPQTIVVPDWVDPDEPATIESACNSFGFTSDGEIDSSVTEYDPVPFDIEPGVGAPTQTRTFSRTSLLAGQGFRVAGTGCDIPGGQFAAVEVAAGSDLSGRNLEDYVASGFGDLVGTDFSAETILTNGGYFYSVSQTSDGPVTIEDIEEQSTLIPPGTYTAIPYCVGDDELLVYEPQLIQVTGAAPTGSIDLTSEKGTDQVTLAGTDAAGDVLVQLGAMSLESLGIDFPTDLADGTTELDGGPVPDLRIRRGPLETSPLGLVDPTRSAHIRSDSTRHRGSRLIPSDDFIELTVTPSSSGAFSYQDNVDFEQGIVEAYASSGDPFADGFVYDPQIVAIDARVATPILPPAQPTTPITPAAPVSAPAPANAVSGRPNYAG